MEITTKNRAELKSYFKKNSIPTEEQFAFLIDGMINPQDDGVVKSADSPLSVQATGDESSPQPVLHLYESGSVDLPIWAIGINAQTKIGEGQVNRLGFNISDGDGVSRLYIDHATGNVGIGSVLPSAQLHLSGGNWHLNNSDGDFMIGTSENNLRIGVATAGGGAGDISFRAKGKLNRMMFGGGDHRAALTVQDDRVGIANASPTERLHVSDGDIAITGGRYRRLKIVSDEYWAGIELVARQKGESGHPHIDFTHGDLDDPNYGVRLHAPNNQRLRLEGTFDVVGNYIYLDDKDDKGRGILLEAADRPMITRTFDKFTSGKYIGAGRWGLFMEPHILTLGIPNLPNKSLQVKKFNANSTDSTLVRINRSGTTLEVMGKAASDGWGLHSDKSLKKNIEPIDSALNKLLDLKGVIFEWRQPEKHGGLQGTQMGLIAQDVQEVFPAWVSEDNGGKLVLTMNGFEALVIESIREIAQKLAAVER